jgi:hypothetical protein
VRSDSHVDISTATIGYTRNKFKDKNLRVAREEYRKHINSNFAKLYYTIKGNLVNMPKGGGTHTCTCSDSMKFREGGGGGGLGGGGPGVKCNRSGGSRGFPHLLFGTI